MANLKDYKKQFLLNKLQENPQAKEILSKGKDIGFGDTFVPTYYGLLQDEHTSEEDFKNRFGISKQEAQQLWDISKGIVQSSPDKSIYQSYIDERKDKTQDLGLEELELLKEAYSGLSSIGTTTQSFNKDSLNDILKPMIASDIAKITKKDLNQTPSHLNEIGEYVARSIIEGNYDAGFFANSLRDRLGGNLNDYVDYARSFPKLYDLQSLKNRVVSSNTTYDDYSAEISPIDQLITALKEKGATDKEINDYLSQLPGELDKETERLMAGETSRAISRYREEMVPEAQKLANVRGQLRSGAMEDYLTTAQVETMGGLENMRGELMSFDLEFIGNAAYQNKIRQLMEADVDVKTALQNERTNVMTQKNQAFTSAQSELNRQQEQKLQEQRYQQQIKAQEVQYRRQQEEAEKAQRGQWYQTAANIAGTVVGTYAGSKMGGGSTPTSVN
jgi:hypothetical protein